MSRQIGQWCQQIEAHWNIDVLGGYHKLVLTRLIIESERKLKTENLPEEIKELYCKNFNRVLDDIESGQPHDLYTYTNDKFLKDLSVCSLRLVPVGARKIHLSVLPVKSFIFKKGFKQLLDSFKLIVFELGGVKPMYVTHTDSKDPDLLSEFNPVGFKKSYIRVAELLKREVGIKGIFTVSWFNDPYLANVTPRLTYIREIVTNNGGKLYYCGPNKEAVKNATMKSQTRRKLYRKGKYLPCNYITIWPRKKLLAWANNQLKRQEAY